MDNHLLETKFIKVMFDYSSTGLWSLNGSNLDMEDVPLSPSLSLKVQEWVKENDRIASESLKYDNQDLFTLEEQVDKKTIEDSLHEYYLKSIYLACLLKEQLPDWTITVFVEYKGVCSLVESLEDYSLDNNRHLKVIPTSFKQDFLQHYPTLESKAKFKR